MISFPSERMTRVLATIAELAIIGRSIVLDNGLEICSVAMLR
jgi:hypothetical protein